MLENIKFVIFIFSSFYLIYAVIRISIMCNKVEKKLKRVTDLKEFKKFYEEN